MSLSPTTPSRLARAFALLCLLPACNAGSDGVARAARSAEPHLDAFAEFDGWARRANIGRQVLDDGEAVGETIFAPLRNDRDIFAAWVDRDVGHSEHYALPRDTVLPRLSDWTTLRDDKLGELRVVARKPCPLDLPSWWRGEMEELRCVLLQREAAKLTVTVAFDGTPKSAAE
jgi:hypothetical protein